MSSRRAACDGGRRSKGYFRRLRDAAFHQGHASEKQHIIAFARPRIARLYLDSIVISGNLSAHVQVPSISITDPAGRKTDRFAVLALTACGGMAEYASLFRHAHYWPRLMI
jgi:hypothetical protein